MKRTLIAAAALSLCLATTANAQVLDDYTTNANFVGGNYDFVSIFAGAGNDPQVTGGELKINTFNGSSTFGTAAFLWNAGEKLVNVGDFVSIELRFDSGPLTAASTHIGLYLSDALGVGANNQEINMGRFFGGNYIMQLVGVTNINLDAAPTGNATLTIEVTAAPGASLDMTATLSGPGFTTVMQPFSVAAAELFFGPVAFDTDGSNGAMDNFTFGNVDPTQFQDSCNGDGGDQLGCTMCPCANEAPMGSIGGCLNSGGLGTRLRASGDPSVGLPSGSTSDLRLTLEDAPPFAFSVLLSGNAVAPQGMANPCFGLNSGVQSNDRDGLRCAVQSIIRHGNRSSDINGDIMDASGPSRVWGGEAQPTAGIAAQGGFVAGQTRYFQVVHRDLPTQVCTRGLNSSQAVRVNFLP